MGDEKLKLLADEKNSLTLGLSSAISAYGVAAIRGAFILNGSAAVAVLTKQATLTAEGVHIVLYCAIGAGLAVLCAGASFVAQWYSQQNAIESCRMGIFSYQKTGDSGAFKVPLLHVRHENISFCIAAALYLASMIFYALAAYKLVDLF